MKLLINTKDINIAQAKSIHDTYVVGDYHFTLKGKVLKLVAPIIDVELLGFLRLNNINFRLMGL